MTGLPHISVCVCTFARPQLLARLLARLSAQVTAGQFTCSAVIVDNDAAESARAVVESARMTSPIQIDYDVEPQRSISHARNRSVRNARGDLIAFIDDDEFPADDWLLRHLRLLLEARADGVLGPVLPHFDGEGPAWLVRSGLLDRSRLQTGEVIRNSRHTRTGNVLLWRKLFEGDDGGFDPKYGRSGGGDAVFFKRMMEQGKVFVWCDEALVYETVPLERQKRSYYLRRACTRGMTAAWETPWWSLGTVRSVVAVMLYTCALPVLFIAGQHHFMRYLVSDCDHLAKLLAYLRIRLVSERPYRDAPQPSQAV
jgi:glycosyltransferase involved in cell wall biosynthesis